jgi:hypothetical protein
MFMETTSLRERDTISPTIPPGQQETAASKLTPGQSRDVETKRREGLLQCGGDFLLIAVTRCVGLSQILAVAAKRGAKDFHACPPRP